MVECLYSMYDVGNEIFSKIYVYIGAYINRYGIYICILICLDIGIYTRACIYINGYMKVLEVMVDINFMYSRGILVER